MQPFKEGEYTNKNNREMKINHAYAGDNAIGRTYGGNMASYFYQAILFAGPRSKAEYITLMQDFFKLTKDFVETKFEMKVTFRKDLKEKLNKLQEINHPYDLRLSVPNGKFLSGYGGPQALFSLLVDDIYGQIHKHLGRDLYIPRGIKNQLSLFNSFSKSNFKTRTAVRYPVFYTMHLNTVKDVLNFVPMLFINIALYPARFTFQKVKNIIKGIRYGYNEKYIFMTTRSGKEILGIATWDEKEIKNSQLKEFREYQRDISRSSAGSCRRLFIL